jgi:integrase
MLRYEALGEVTRKQACEILNQRITAAGNGKAPTRSRVTFRTLAGEWDVSVLPMYKHSTQKHRRFMLKKHLLPQFGDMAVSDVTRQEIQAYVAHLTQLKYAPKSIDHIHDVLSAILRTAVKWGHLQENPAHGVDLPTLRCVRPKWSLTTGQAAALLTALPPLARTMVGLAILSGLRRGELFALRWKDIQEQARLLTVREAVYDGTFDTPKTEAGSRRIPLSATAVRLIVDWKAHTKNKEPDALVFGTRLGLAQKQIHRFGEIV